MASRLRACATLACIAMAACTSGGPAATGSPTTPTSSASAGSPPPLLRGAWTTFHRDPARTGFDPTSPPVGSVRRAWGSAVLDGEVYAEPLVFRGHVLVATENDSIYSLDAATGRVAWRTHVGEPVPRSSLPCGNIDPTGITGTPAIDRATGVLYALAFVRPGRHELVAIDTTDGRVRFRRPADPDGADPLVHQQRAALAIANGHVYAAYGGLFGDCGDYHGMVVGLALDGRGPLLTYRVPSGRAAGIWAPSGPAVDPAGDLLVVTGNSFSSSSFDFGNSVIRLSPALRMVDWFAPGNWLQLNQGDVDLGSVGPALLRGGLVFVIGKEGVGYLLTLDDLGRMGGQAFSGPVCDGAAFGGTATRPPLVYVPCSAGVVALRVRAGPSFAEAWRGPGFPAGPPIVAGGAVWVVDVGAGALVVLDAGTGRETFRTSIGSVTHFTSPASAGGHVYVAADRRVLSFSGA